MPRNKINEFEQNIRNQIANNLRMLTKRYGINQRILAQRAKIPYTTISGYFNAKSTPNPGAVQKMADAIGTSKSDIDPRFNSGFGSDDHQLINVSDFVNIPLLGEIACGKPITAEQNVDGYIPTEKADLPSGNVFWLTCKGESMLPTLPDGAHVLVHEQPTVEDREIAAVLIDDEATLKRVKHVSGGKVILSPDNKEYDPIILDGSTSARILGKAIEVKIKL